MQPLRLSKIFFVVCFIAPVFFLWTPFAEAQYETPSACDENARGIVPCGRICDDPSTPEDETLPCTLCHFIIGIKKLIDYGLALGITAAIVAIFFAGTIYMISAGNQGLMTAGKNFLVAALIGFSVILTAWLLVNVILWIVSSKDAMGVRSGESWWEFNCDPVSRSGMGSLGRPNYQSASGTGQKTDLGTPDGYRYDPGIETQTKDASGALNQLLSCMQPKLPSQAKIISSISDSAGIEKCRNAWSRPPCAHSKNSCHYGGKSCETKSYAVDFGNESYASQITAVAKECNPRAYIKNEGDHIHISVGMENDCDCN